MAIFVCNSDIIRDWLRGRMVAERTRADGQLLPGADFRIIMRRTGNSKMRRRKGLATLDYVLVLGVILPLAAFLLRVGPRIIRFAYEMVCVIVSWPFM